MSDKAIPVVDDEGQNSGYSTADKDKGAADSKGSGHVGNPNQNVGGTAQDGGLSTADTVRDGGPDGEEKDGDFKPS